MCVIFLRFHIKCNVWTFSKTNFTIFRFELFWNILETKVNVFIHSKFKQSKENFKSYNRYNSLTRLYIKYRRSFSDLSYSIIISNLPKRVWCEFRTIRLHWVHNVSNNLLYKIFIPRRVAQTEVVVYATIL